MASSPELSSAIMASHRVRSPESLSSISDAAERVSSAFCRLCLSDSASAVFLANSFFSSCTLVSRCESAC